MGYPRWRRFMLFDCLWGSLSFFTELIMCVGFARRTSSGTISTTWNIFWTSLLTRQSSPRCLIWSRTFTHMTSATSWSWYTGDYICFHIVCVCVGVLCLMRRVRVTAVFSTCRIQVSAAHSPRAHTGRSMKGWGETFLSKTLKEKHSLGRWDNWSCDDYIKTQLQPPFLLLLSTGNIKGGLVLRFSIRPSRCGPVWQHIPISPTTWRTSGGTTTLRGSMTRCHLMEFGL